MDELEHSLNAMFYDMEGNPIEDVKQWAILFGKKSRQIAKTTFYIDEEVVEVSTVWLGIDHSYTMRGRPLIFETMIFGGEHDQYQDRHTTKVQAYAGHLKACDLVVFGGENDDGET